MVLALVLAVLFVGFLFSLAAGLLFHFLGIAISGLFVGALGRLAVPGRNPMGVGMTVLVGLAGSFLGWVAGWVLFRGSYGGLLALTLSVTGAAFVVWLLQRGRPRAI